MALYVYKKKKENPHRRLITGISYSSMIIGSLFLFWSLYPILFFEMYSFINFRTKPTSPLPEYSSSFINTYNSVLGVSSILSTNLSDYTKAGVWFPSVAQKVSQDLKVKEYTLSIPRLNITNAKVIVGGDDLLKGLVHYAPKSLPGMIGNVAIFGHSLLPQLAKRGNDYRSIFTYLPSMERGDEIYSTVDGVAYEYKVVDIFVVNPNEISVLNQTDDDVYMSLITCVPPGTLNQRLVVKAKMDKL
ncbi:hypothetical protein A3C23_05540 [Candidatus Roizmanbacteria bacterium RIFCSPHIGHO2_02_FULL_37_13b]|uniref:Sortase n=1 Tax=Candidatus Roizmanbacteria bacterium RIFCSPLOWO2_02_FULL_36_11 TaxID=1802071 RepID=A0A1F7JCJ0_9BACT|nr:MAG: hypothetical protein A3C23_05540 [Candidatus Roizmanbacteria bacterium RIFCSPHIGHO2_02_FULL_37_13b]OGK53295.1 MAG: hypothetical protein A3H78_03250 [Candidatus Roizmanbacteria bacterium RIFCSPLOWO2_02_FULL_36_11]